MAKTTVIRLTRPATAPCCCRPRLALVGREGRRSSVERPMKRFSALRLPHRHSRSCPEKDGPMTTLLVVVGALLMAVLGSAILDPRPLRHAPG